MALADAKLLVTELLASLSLATDLATGRPLGHGLSTSLLSMSLAREVGCDADQVRQVQQVALIRFLGCTSDAAETAVMAGGDELSFMTAFAPAHMGGSGEALRAMVGTVGAGRPLPRRARLVAAALANPGAGARGLAGHCEVGAMLARRLGLADRVTEALGYAYERWDGKGPSGLVGDEIPLEVRVTMVARDADMFARLGEDVASILRQRQGRAYDPTVVEAFIRLSPTHRDAEWEEVIRAEPEPATHIEDLDDALTAVADFVDIKSPWTRGHSRQVSELARRAGELAGVGSEESRLLGQAGLVHDLGRVGIENGIWDKSDGLGAGEWEKVRLHPYLTGRVLSRCEALSGLSDLASSHHERIDGTGYHRGISGGHLSDSARILAAADVLAALTAERPYRSARTLEEAARVLKEEANDGLLDPKAADWVVAAAGGPPARAGSPNPGGLSDREVEVLRLLARGHTNRRLGEELFISPKTVGRHVENIYAKIGVSTRAGATVFAMEHRLLG